MFTRKPAALAGAIWCVEDGSGDCHPVPRRNTKAIGKDCCSRGRRQTMTEPSIKSTAETASFTWRGVWRGFRVGQPLGIAAFVYGVAFGLVAHQASISVAEALLMSAVVYSGSAQLAAVSVINQSTSWASANSGCSP